MVSFGFLGTPKTISIEEYEMLAKFGLNSLAEVTDSFHNRHYVFRPNIYKKVKVNTEKKVTNISKFLEVDLVVESGVNSILNTNLKADVILIHGGGKLATYFQSKSSDTGLQKYKEKYLGMELDPFYQKGEKYNDFEERNQLQKKYEAPGAVYLSTDGKNTLPEFLKEFSEWVDLPVKEDYQKLLNVLLAATKPLSSKILQRVFHDSNVMEKVTHLGTIHFIDVSEGYVQLKRRKAKAESNTCS